MTKNTVLPGLDALRANRAPDASQLLRGRRLGLLTNHTGCALDGTPALAVLRELGLDVRALFAPEHGFGGTREGAIESSRTADDLPIFSLYGTTRRPTPQMLDGVEILICDLQDVGARFYTYASTLAHCLDECARLGIAVLVLDRPNPLGGEVVEGPMMEEKNRSFIGTLKVPVRHGLTMGELARFYVSQAELKVELSIARVENWRREMMWPQTGLPWRRPSPNLPDFRAAAWYPGLCLLEFSNLSVGRGTSAPFQILAAPWLEPEKLLAALPAWPEIAEIEAEILEITPGHAVFAGEKCRAVRFFSANGEPQRPVALGMAVLAALARSHRQIWSAQDQQAALPLIGSGEVLNLLLDGEADAARELAARESSAFREACELARIY